jgi:hypothetical protein
MRKINGILWVFIFAAANFASPAIINRAKHHFLPTAPYYPHGKIEPQQLQRSLAKRALLQWELVGSAHYERTAGTADSTAWTFDSRDTFLFDGGGNRILSETSRAATGWAADSLSEIDSAIYEGGRLVKYVRKPGLSNANSYEKEIFTYANGGTVFVHTSYTMYYQNEWTPVEKDSMIFSAPAPADYSQPFSLSNVVAQYLYSFDPYTGAWLLVNNLTKIDSQSDATVLTEEGQYLTHDYLDTGDHVDIRYVSTFRSPIWVPANMSQWTMQTKNPSTGTYSDYAKEVYTVDANNFQTGFSYFFADTTTDSLALLVSEILFPDAHGNDTLEIDFMFNAGTRFLDTTDLLRYSRVYDANGNDVVTVESDYNAATNSVRITKDVNTFAQINAAVLSRKQPASQERISAVATPTRVIVTAPAITRLMLYNAAGRLVASVNQQPSASISLDLSGNGRVVSSGVYMATIVYGNRQSSLRLAILGNAVAAEIYPGSDHNH